MALDIATIQAHNRVASNKLIKLGIIASAVGLSGCMRIKLSECFSTTFDCKTDHTELLNVFLFNQKKGEVDDRSKEDVGTEKTSTSCKIISCRNGFLTVQLDGVVSRSEAESLRHYLVMATYPSVYNAITNEHERLKLSLFSMSVRYDGDDAVYGVVLLVQNFGASDLLLVESSDGKTFYHPFTTQFVKHIDYGEGEIVLLPI